MMANLVQMVEDLKAYVNAITAGVDRSIHMLPIIARQKIAAKAKGKLNSTYDNYMNAVSSKIHDNILIIEIDKDNWLANATESGMSAYDMKEGLLNGKNAKISKKGHRYASVPMGKNKNTEPSRMGTPKQEEYQRIIQKVMNKPKYGKQRLKHNQDGSLTESQQVVSNEIKGLYRIRKHKSAKDFFSGNSKGKYGLVMFRTVSENGSLTGATWEHPGIKPANILKQLEKELPEIFEVLLETNIEAELKGLGF